MSITKVPSQVMAFSANKPDVYIAFADYMRHYRAINQKRDNLEYQKTYTNKDGQVVEFSLGEKEERLNAAIKKEIMRVAQINFSEAEALPLEAWANHPTLKWATFAVVSALIDMILPETLIDTIGLYTDVRTIGFGDSAAFDIKPRDLFIVSKAGRGKRTTELHKQFDGQVTVLPEPRQLAVTVSLYRVLSGKENLGEFTMKAVRSLETQMTYDVYSTFATAMDAVDNTASTGLRVAGYTQAEFVRLSQTTRAWNGGANPIAIGTQAALANILPAD